MAEIVYSRRALSHLKRAVDFLTQNDPGTAAEAARAIRTAVEALASHPFLGRRISGELRELVISFGRTGYVALYRVVSASGEVRILAIKHQRELGYRV